MTDILNIKDEPIFDDRIVKIETHTYNPFANTMFGYSDEIRIPIQQQDLYILQYESFLYVEGKLTKNRAAEGANVALGNNCVAFIFDEIRYELNGVEIDRNRNVGITSTLKNYVTVSSDRSVILRNAGDISRFDDCKLTNAKLYLNSECYPYDDLNLDFEKNRCAILYDSYARFCKGYYGYEYLKPSLTFTTFLRYGPFVIIDFSRQNESVKSGTVDVRLDFECKENVPANTTAYCLIIHDRVVQYNPLTNVVRKIT
ncbi:hypothetical protein ALC57_07921 [Trachymyrmex cornetzi]|uniref:Double jelly roll-like domain-containing protein n=1 Tax=Trachymyrmex cornetzi TaxID=471704 RepID=A0A151J7F6_9HYME|nr:hypothetical protein ALC57_07921 [Trachymyrmex cornetzi]